MSYCPTPIAYSDVRYNKVLPTEGKNNIKTTNSCETTNEKW